MTREELEALDVDTVLVHTGPQTPWPMRLPAGTLVRLCQPAIYPRDQVTLPHLSTKLAPVRVFVRPAALGPTRHPVDPDREWIGCWVEVATLEVAPCR